MTDDKRTWGSRRDFLGATGMGLVMAGSASAEPAPAKAPRDVGRKFFANGQVRPFAGNTIISHLPQQDGGYQAFNAVLDVYRDMPLHGFSRKLSFLPTSSYHMTVFGGPTDQGRDKAFWPADVPLDAPIGRCNEILAERLAGFRMGVDLPFRMKIDDRNPPGAASPITLHLAPADEHEAAKLRRVRDGLAERLRLRAADHDRYQFHVTIAYQIEAFTPSEQEAYASAMAGWRAALARRAPIIEIGAPEYCVFEDMFAFQRRFTLRA